MISEHKAQVDEFLTKSKNPWRGEFQHPIRCTCEYCTKWRKMIARSVQIQQIPTAPFFHGEAA